MAEVTHSSLQTTGESIYYLLEEICEKGFTPTRKDALQKIIYDNSPFVTRHPSGPPEGIAPLMWGAFMQQYRAGIAQLAQDLGTKCVKPPEADTRTVAEMNVVAGAVEAGTSDVVETHGGPEGPTFFQRHRVKLFVAGGVAVAAIIGGVIYSQVREDD
jgi:hypothetical protein